MRHKLTSRKFWLSLAAFLGSIGTSIAGFVTDNDNIIIIGIICSIISAGIYAAAEAATDCSNLENNVTITEYKETNDIVDYDKGYTDAVDDVISTISDMKEE